MVVFSSMCLMCRSSVLPIMIKIIFVYFYMFCLLGSDEY
jgi:hypothetical protein